MMTGTLSLITVGVAALAATTAVRGASPPTLPEWGAVRIEAENYDEGGEGVGYHKTRTNKMKTARDGGKPFRPEDAVSTDNANGGIAITHWEKGDWTRYTVNAAASGNYAICFRYCRGNGVDGSLDIAVNDTPQAKALKVPPTRDWWTYADLTAVVQLRKGENVIRLGSDVGEINLDSFDLARSTTFNHDGAAWLLESKGAVRLEAEDFDVNPAAAVVVKDSNGAKSNYRPESSVRLVAVKGPAGLAVADFTAGERLDYSTRAQLSGLYTLRIRHAGNGEAKLRFLLNDTDRTGACVLPTTGGAWRTAETRLLCKKGANLLRMEAVAGSVSIDWIELEKDPNTPVVLADPKGKGSYAAEPPDVALERTRELFDFVYDEPCKWINRPDGEPLPSNQWWSNILHSKSPFTGSLWPYPIRVQVTAEAVTVNGYNKVSDRAGGFGMEGGQAIPVAPAEGKFTRNALVTFGDWSVCLRVEQTADKYADVTIARGMPMAWYEFHDIDPVLPLGFGPGSKTELYDDKDAALTGTFTTDRVRIDRSGIPFGLFAPEGTEFSVQGKSLTVKFSGQRRFLVVTQLPSASSFGMFAEHAFAIPRDTKFDYTYDAHAGTVTTTWKIAAEPLKPGASTDVVQGWVPHNYRDIASGPKLLPDVSYASINGPIKLSIGNHFTIVQPAPNMSLIWPTPRPIGGKSDYDPERMARWLDALAAGDAAEPKYGGDTYFGMKDIQRYAEEALIARQLGHPGYATLLNALKVSMTDWFTYTPGEELHYFARYPRHGALIGFGPSFGSEHFTDNHFHYGYHAVSAGVLAMLDEQWGKDYGEMARQVVKQYANWDRSDRRFPHFRTFEPWSGHSYAGGRGDPRGNNQESVSEAIQSWAGLVMLGQALNDEAMTAAGMMGFTIEEKAAAEYWFDGHRDLFPKGFDRSNVAIYYDDSKGAGTFFSAQPEHVLGIIALPVWPNLDYMGRYPEAMKYACERMLKQRPVFFKGDASKGTWESMDNPERANSWLSINLGIYAHVDPQFVADMYEKMWTEKTGTGTSPETAMYYWQTHAYRSNGLRDFSRRLSTVIGAAYYEPNSKRRVYVAYNPSASPVEVQVLDVASNKVVDTFGAKPRDLTLHVVEAGK